MTCQKLQLFCLEILFFFDNVKSPTRFNFGPIHFPVFRTLYISLNQSGKGIHREVRVETQLVVIVFQYSGFGYWRSSFLLQQLSEFSCCLVHLLAFLTSAFSLSNGFSISVHSQFIIHSSTFSFCITRLIPLSICIFCSIQISVLVWDKQL